MIPTLAALHPQVVHFTIVLAIIGAAFRVVSLLGKPAFASPAATTLLLLAALAAVISNQSGTAAHGPVERVPGSRAAVQAHEEWGQRTEYGLLALGAIELVALAMRRSQYLRTAHAVAAVAALICVGLVYETGEHGGTLVYSYAGGVGIRTGDEKDIERLLLAGYYHQAMADRKAGRADSAAQLITAAANRHSADPELQLLAAEPSLLDNKNAQGTIDALANLQPPPQLRVRKGMLQADAFEALGQKDAAIAVLQATVAQTPNARVQQRIDRLQGKSPAP